MINYIGQIFNNNIALGLDLESRPKFKICFNSAPLLMIMINIQVMNVHTHGIKHFLCYRLDFYIFTTNTRFMSTPMKLQNAGQPLPSTAQAQPSG